jgi:hypothetical protein
VAFGPINIVLMRSSLGNSDGEEDGEHENDADIELGNLSYDDRLCWVRGTISQMVQQYMV